MTEIKTSEAIKLYNKIEWITIEKDYGDNDIAIYINLYDREKVLNSEEVYRTENEEKADIKVKSLVKKYKDKRYKVREI